MYKSLGQRSRMGISTIEVYNKFLKIDYLPACGRQISKITYIAEAVMSREVLREIVSKSNSRSRVYVERSFEGDCLKI